MQNQGDKLALLDPVNELSLMQLVFVHIHGPYLCWNCLYSTIVISESVMPALHRKDVTVKYIHGLHEV